MSSKFDIRQIISDHLKTLTDSGSTRPRIDDTFVFFGVPALSAALYFILAGDPPAGRETKVDEVLVSAFAIFAALLLNIQVFLLSVNVERKGGVAAEPGTEESGEDRALRAQQVAMRDKFLEELFSNISYAILVASSLVGLTLITIFIYIDQWRIVKSVQFFMMLHFSLTLYMVMKRIHVLFGALRRSRDGTS